MLPEIPPITAYSPQGKALVATLRGLLRGVHLWRGKQWQRPPQYFHEDPRLFTKSDILFFAYKYYFRPTLESDEKESVEDFFEQNPPVFSQTTPSVNEVTLTAAGDLMPYEWIQKRFCPHLWDDIADDFFSSDLCFANLETPLDVTQPASLVPEVMLSDMNFNANEEMFELFKGSKFDVLSTANNHSLDMGEQGVFKTIEYLETKNIAFTGTARSAEERKNFPIIEKNGIKIAFIAYTFSMNQYVNPEDKPFLVNHLEVNQPDVDLTPLKNDVALAHQRGAEFVILSLHFSNAYQAYPNAHVVKNAQRIFDECGVDVILGGHAHNIQPMARYNFRCPLTQRQKAGLVLFSFSDFIAYDIFNGCHLSVYLKLKISKNTDGVVSLADVQAVPVYACGIYKNKKERDLRLLDAKKWVLKIKNGEKPDFMKDWNIKELTALMAFYEQYFAKNLKA
ncbi:MAG: CapA family protein [Saprospiraceae bacterium]|nr:CapA family protein [Saprospiraceae bacterium]